MTQNTRLHEAKKRKSLVSIKEFSEVSGIKQSTLRYWDEIGLFRPAQRDAQNSYRYYSPDQIMMASFLRMLSSLRMPLKVMWDISQNRSPENILSLMHQQEIIIDAELSRLREAYANIHTLCDAVRQGLSVTNPGGVSIQSLGEMSINFGPRCEPQVDRSFNQRFQRYCLYAKQNNINLSTCIGGYFDSMEHFLRAPSLPTRFFAVDPQGRDKRAAGTYIVGHTYGHYGQMGEVAKRLGDFAAQQDLLPNGAVYVQYLLNAITVQEPSSYLTQICVAL